MALQGFAPTNAGSSRQTWPPKARLVQRTWRCTHHDPVRRLLITTVDDLTGMRGLLTGVESAAAGMMRCDAMRRLSADSRAGRSPALAEHRLLGDGRSAALLRPDTETNWWCVPELDSPPVLWSLLDPGGSARRVVRSRAGEHDPRPASPGLGDWCLSPRGGATAFVIVSEECCCW